MLLAIFVVLIGAQAYAPGAKPTASAVQPAGSAARAPMVGIAPIAGSPSAHKSAPTPATLGQSAPRSGHGPDQPEPNPRGRTLQDHAPWTRQDPLLGTIPWTSARPGTGGASSIVSVSGQASFLGGQKLIYYVVTIDPGTGFLESFIVFVPGNVTGPRPMLVGFHGFGVSQYDIPLHTTMVYEAHRRGWYLCAPLGASQLNFSSLEGQANTQAVLEWMLALVPNVDENRIYGIGFSMGGGWATNYAARHLDPSKPMFAALVNHTGGVALKNTLLNEGGFIQTVFDFWFGNNTPGSAEPWKMARSSIVNFDPITFAVEPDADLARNLMHVPLLSVRASNDPIAYLMTQNDVLHAHFLALGRLVGPTYGYLTPAASTHDWSTLDMKLACDFVGQFSLTLPNQSSTLADHDGRYFHFDVVQDAAGAFTPFDWDLNAAANSFTLSGTKNLERLRVDLSATPLVPTQVLTISLSTADQLADELVLEDVPSLPTSVTRDGLAAISGVDWTYDAPTKSLTLLESDGAATHLWVVTP